jgi:ABC-type branched-subunit amino acid transport system ATPase component
MRLELTDVHSGYGSATVIRGVDLAVPDAGAVAIVGRNGMGKSTLLKTVLGYLRPTSGSIRVDGDEVGGELTERIVRRGVAYGPQAEAVFGALSVEDNLHAAARGVSPVRWNAVLDFFPVLGRRLRQRAGTLSGGEQKMLVLARCLLAEPRLLVLDEITAGLQPSMVTTVINALQWERAERGTTLLMVEQNIDASLTVCEHVAVLKRGLLLDEAGTTPSTARAALLAQLAP